MKNLFKNRKALIAFLGIIGIVLTTVGVTVAWFSYARNGLIENSITSGNISFIYEENDNARNGISLEDALPMPDSYGKELNTYFDFKVKGNAGTAKIPYEITLKAKDGSDNIGDSVKVYLTEIDGTSEEEKVLSIYDSLANSTNTIAALNNEKTLYESEIPAGSRNYTDNYRLRMWLNDNTEDGNVLSFNQSVRQECSDTNYTTKETCEGAGANWLDVAVPATAKIFVLKVNVYAEGKAATQQEIADANSTGINNISIAENNAVENVDTSLGYDYSIVTTDSNATITVTPANSKAKATIVPYDPSNPTAMNSKVRRLSTSKTFPLETGDNYFKVTIKSANKKNESEYILKVIKGLSYDASLSSLSIENCALNEKFDKDTLSYTCTSEATSLYPTYTLSDSRANAVMANNENLVIGDNSITITVTAEDGKTTQTYTVLAAFEGNFNYKTVTGDSILGILKDNDLSEGYYKFKINGKTEEYKVHLYTFNGDQVWDTDHTFGTASDVASGTDEAQMAKHMVAVKVNGDLTNSAKIEPYYTEYGGPKGFTLYVTGTLTNTGTIDNSHGAYAKGDDVYLLKSEDGSYEVVPAVGGSGGVGKTTNSIGNAGTNGQGRQTGGGGNANTDNLNLKGGDGTSYSGGSGGGNLTSGSDIGGAGGQGQFKINQYNYAGGTGNPGGCSAGARCGLNGTGGLLIIYANSYENNGQITAMGYDTAQYNSWSSGGASGGGSINVFYNYKIASGTLKANGGKSYESYYVGGPGGAGTVTMMKVIPNTVTFNANGGNVTETSRQLPEGHEIGNLPIPTSNSGLIFVGWYTSLDFTTKVTSDYIVNEDVILYAKWKETLDEEISYTGKEYTYYAALPGLYKLEVWGAQGGSYSSQYYGGYGGYSVGFLNVNNPTDLYVNVGGTGACGKYSNEGGYNGGGSSYTYSYSSCVGGGATHIALDSGLLSKLSPNTTEDRIIIVAGGGGGAISNSDYSSYATGGSGGGITGGLPIGTSNRTKQNIGTGGSQTAGGNFGVFYNSSYSGVNADKSNGKFGLGGMSSSTGNNIYVAGGGGGYYGGGAGYLTGGTGGSGYLASSLMSSNEINKHMYCYNCSSSTDSETYTISNGTSSCHNSTATEDCAKEENGYARITYVGSSSSVTPSSTQLNQSRSALAGAGLASILNNK